LASEQQLFEGPMLGGLDGWLKRRLLRTRAQSSMSSENSLVSFGVVQSPMALAQVMLAPPTPIAQTPRRSFSFSPARISLNMIVFDEPSSLLVSEGRVVPQLTPKMPPPPGATPFWTKALSRGGLVVAPSVPAVPSRVWFSQPGPALAA